jgi:hypothetical protein
MTTDQHPSSYTTLTDAAPARLFAPRRPLDLGHSLESVGALKRRASNVEHSPLPPGASRGHDSRTREAVTPSGRRTTRDPPGDPPTAQRPREAKDSGLRSASSRRCRSRDSSPDALAGRGV